MDPSIRQILNGAVQGPEGFTDPCITAFLDSASSAYDGFEPELSTDTPTDISAKTILFQSHPGMKNSTTSQAQLKVWNLWTLEYVTSAP